MRARYDYAIAWIAENDNPGDWPESMDPDALAGTMTVILVADLWGRPESKVASDVVRYREREMRMKRPDSDN